MTTPHTIANALQKNDHNTYEEVHGVASVAENDGVRRIDTTDFKPGASEAYITDPTIKFESHVGQVEEVNAVKSIQKSIIL